MFLSVQEFVLTRVNESHESGFARRRSSGLKSTRPITYNTVQQTLLLLRDVILVDLGFHMCAHCLSMLAPFSQA